MKRIFSALCFGCAVLAMGQVGGIVFANRLHAASARPKVIRTEDALDAFFRDLDRKSTTLNPLFETEELPVVPDFPGRAELLERFTKRLPQIDALRLKRLVGETSRGFMEHRGEAQNVDFGAMHEENTDRLALYEAIATQARARVDDVGKTRGAKLISMCKRGVWVRDADGNWTQKI